MAKGYSAETVGVLDGSVTPARKADGRVYRAKMRSLQGTFNFTLAAVKGAIGDTNSIGMRYPGDMFRGGSVTISASLGSATLSIGTAGNPTKYMAATTFTTPDQPVGFGKLAAMLDEITAPEEIIVTIGAAAITTQTVIVHLNTTAR